MKQLSLEHRRGQATVEYVLIVAVLLAALITAISSGSFGTSIKGLFTNLSTLLQTSVGNIPTATP